MHFITADDVEKLFSANAESFIALLKFISSVVNEARSLLLRHKQCRSI